MKKQNKYLNHFNSKKMNRSASFFLRAVILLAFIFPSLKTFSEQLSPRITNYSIDAKLDPDSKIIDGKMVLTWTNPSEDTVSTLQFHMYLNAFKNTESTFIKE